MSTKRKSSGTKVGLQYKFADLFWGATFFDLRVSKNANFVYTYILTKLEIHQQVTAKFEAIPYTTSHPYYVQIKMHSPNGGKFSSTELRALLLLAEVPNMEMSSIKGIIYADPFYILVGWGSAILGVISFFLGNFTIISIFFGILLLCVCVAMLYIAIQDRNDFAAMLKKYLTTIK